MRRISVDPVHPSPEAIAQVAEVIRRGGIAVCPTDTLYGIAADPRQAAAVGRVFAAKGRPDGKPLLLVAASIEQAEQFVGSMSARVRALAEGCWPGPLTILFPAPAGLADAVAGGTGRVGIRVPNHATARALCAAAGTPLTATSANRAGEAPASDPGALSADVLSAADVLLDAGATPGGPASTIVDVTADGFRLLREGAISLGQVEACWNRA